MYTPKYFTLRELLYSYVAEKRGIDNTPVTFEVVENLNRLCRYILDPIRELYGSVICVTSGYRSPELNEAVGGVPNSQHTRGLAVDVVCTDLNKLFSIIQRDGIFDHVDQLIYEKDKKGTCWLHVSISRIPRNIVIDKR